MQDGAALRAALRGLPQAVFAVVDGARNPGFLPMAERLGLPLAPLFRGPTEAERQGGPLLAGPLSPVQRDTLMALVADPTALVIWTMDDMPEALATLSAHLRRINAVRGPEPSGPTTPRGEDALLLLRHADALTLSLLAQVLTRDQVREFLGPASGIVYHDPRTGAPVIWTHDAVEHLPETFAPVFAHRPQPG